MTKKRTPHYLKPTKGNNRPLNFCFFDTETKEEKINDEEVKLLLKIGVAKTYRSRRSKILQFQKELVFKDNDTFWSWFLSSIRDKTTTYLIAHNLPFDLVTTDAFLQLPKRGWELKSFYFKGQTGIFRWSKGDKRIVGVDNGNFFVGTLASWGKRVNLSKMKVDFDSDSLEYLIEYCKRDVDIMVELWRTWLRFLDDNDCGEFKLTTSSTAFNTWRYRFLKRKVWIHDNKEVLELERESYYGGRCEPLFQGKIENGNFYYLDFNSLYPSVMLENKFPTSIIDHKDNPTIEYIEKLIQKYAIVARVIINTEKAYFPTRKDGRLIFPLGTFQTTLSTPEIKIALENGYIKQVLFASWYHEANIFEEYVRYFYTLRKKYQEQNEDGFNKICKLLMNSLYGKFGQRGMNQEIIGTCPPDEVSRESYINTTTKKNGSITRISGNVFLELPDGESYHSSPVIAAHVTAYGRVKLWKAVRKAGLSNCFYTDTDSIVTNQKGYDNLKSILNDDLLGALKVETQSTWIEIRARKDYAMEGRDKHKGVKPNAIQLSKNVYQQNQFAGLRGLIQNNTLDGVRIRRVTKTLTRELKSGILLPSGYIQRERVHHTE